MKILYVTPLVAGFQDLLEGKKESKGLPSFIFPLKKLLESNNIVDIILISNYSGPIDIQVSWINNKNILANINNDFATTRGLRRFACKIKSLIELLGTVSHALNKGKYDFVYCHGTAAYAASVLANIYHVRCGYRIYGVVGLASELKEKGLNRAKKKNPIYYKIFTKKKDFLLITDDGTHGDYVFEMFNPKNTFPVYYLVNGIDKSYEYSSQTDVLEANNCSVGNYLFHAGRISRIKRQDRVIKVLYELHKRGMKKHVLLAGHISDLVYFNELNRMIEEYCLSMYVHFIGAIERVRMQSLSHDALATILLGEVSNQGNVFFECAFAGSVIITYPEQSLSKYIVDKESGFFVESEESAVLIVEKIIEGKMDCDTIRNNLKKRVDNMLVNWEDRVKTEMDIIYGETK